MDLACGWRRLRLLVCLLTTGCNCVAGTDSDTADHCYRSRVLFVGTLHSLSIDSTRC